MDLDEKLLDEFRFVVGYSVAEHYKGNGFISRRILMWNLTKLWNSGKMRIGISGQVRDKLGEEKATRLFQDIASEIIYDPKLLDEAIKDRNKRIEEFFG